MIAITTGLMDIMKIRCEKMDVQITSVIHIRKY